MTTIVLEESAEPAREERRYRRRRQPFGDHVADAVAALQRDYLRHDSYAIAVMARLRAALTNPPGSDYTILSHTQVSDVFLGSHLGDEPTDAEWAKHLALALYALHQQSIYDTSMHRDGVGLGSAIGELSMKTASEDAVRRRFAALGTAISFDEVTYHLRSLIRLLRDKRIAIDYGLLADDLRALRHPDGQVRIRALWGREYYRRSATTGSDVSSAETSSEQATDRVATPDKE